MINDIWKLTSIKVLSDVYKKFKDQGKGNNITLQKLVNRSMYMYLNDSDFAEKIQSVKDLKENYKNGY
jgi:uncharacterized protein (DUF4415 family)|tara:strand:+ start:523 stop:726 length:204 start_codon:yes stop_codon:yes gene_type:complete